MLLLSCVMKSIVCCLVQYSVALAEYAESERVVVLEGRVRRYRDADAYVDVDVAKVDVVVVVGTDRDWLLYCCLIQYSL